MPVPWYRVACPPRLSRRTGTTFVAGVGGWGIYVQRRFPDLSVDNMFGGGLVFVPVADSPAAPFLRLLALPDGGVLIGYVGLSGHAYLARVAANGDVGETAALQVWPAHLARQPDGSILVAGSFRQSFATSEAPEVLTRFDVNLSPDDHFGTNGIVRMRGAHPAILGVTTTFHQRIVVGLERGSANHLAFVFLRLRE